MAELDIAINPSGAVRGGNVVKQMMRDIKDAASGLNGSMVNLGATMGRVMGTGPALFATGLGAMAAAAISAGKATASHIEAIQKFAVTTNLSTREAQMFASMARQTGTDLNAMSGGMGKLNENLQEAAKGSGDSQRLFGALGIAVKDTNGQVRTTGTVFEEVVGKLGDFKNDAAKTTVISKLLGDEMQQMARIGKSGFQNLSNEAKVMNSILGEDSVKAAEKFNQQIARTGTILEGWKLKIGETVLPYLNDMLAAINKFATGRELPAMPEFGGPGGKGSLVLPPDPASLRRQLEEETKQRQDARQRDLDIAGILQETETALLRKSMTSRRDMETTELQALIQDHQSKMGLLVSEEQKIQDLINIEKERFKASQNIGGVTDDERRLQAMQHGGTMADLQGKLKSAQGKTNLQGIVFDTEELDAAGKAQEALGQQITDRLISSFQIGEDLRHRDQDDAQAYYQNLAKFQEAYGTSRENQMTTEYDMVRANLAKQLDVTQDTAAKVLNAWRNGDSIHAAELLDGTRYTWDQVTTIMLGAMADQRQVSEKFSDDFFAGFAKSMKKYVDDTSVFGLGIDQARRVAQGMEQGFGKFFFDAMEGRIQSFKDVVQGLTDFAKNITSQLAGTLVTNSILKGLSAGMPSLFGNGSVGGLAGGAGDVGGFALRANGGISAFAGGGIASRPMLRWAGGGLNLIGEGQYNEAYVPLPDGRTIPVTMKMAGQMMSTISVPVKVEVYNQNSGQTQVETQTQQGSDGSQTIKIFVREAVKDSIAKGEFDQSMGSRYGAKPQPVRR